jgi:O-antigen ligase
MTFDQRSSIHFKIMLFTKEHLLFLRYVIPVFPLLLLTGPFFPDLILSLTAMFYVIYITKNRSWADFFNQNYNKFFFIFYLIMIISSLLSDYVLYSLKTSIFYIRFIFFLNAIIYISNNDKNLLKNFCIVSFFTLILVSFDTIFQFNFGYNIIGLETHNKVRMGSFFGEELIVGSFLARLFPFIIIYLFFFNEKSINIFTGFATILFIGIAIFLSGERTAFLFFLISLFSIFLFIKKKKFFIIFSIILLIIFSYVILKNKNFSNRIIYQTINQVYDFENKKIFFFSKEHTVLSIISLQMFKEHKILGIGPKNFRKYCSRNEKNFEFLKEYKPDHYCSTHPHNIFFQFISETGIIGTIFYLIFFLGAIKIFLNEIFRNKKNIKSIFLLTALIISIFPLAPSGHFFNNWLSTFLFLILSFLIHEFRNTSKDTLKNTHK